MKTIETKIFGETIRSLRENLGLPLRKVSAILDIDPSTLSKIERGEREANKEMIPHLAKLFSIDEKELSLILISDRMAKNLLHEDNPNEILRMVEEKIKFLKSRSLYQSSIDFKNQ